MNALSILVVDDEAAARGSLAGILESAGHHVTAAANGAEALRLIAERHFDLVATDILMPEMDGVELIGEIREQLPHARILAVSGGGSFLPGSYCGKLAQFMGAGASIAKPFVEREVFAALDAVFGSDCTAAN